MASFPESAIMAAMSCVSRYSARISAARRRGRRAALLSGSRGSLSSSVRRRISELGVVCLAAFFLLPAPFAFCQDASSSERAALTDLFHATNGRAWQNNTNWLSESPVCDWYGVICSSLTRSGTYGGEVVAGLFLSHNRLAGRIPDSVSHLSGLQSLNLADNDLTGSLPTELLDRWDRGEVSIDVRSTQVLAVFRPSNFSSSQVACSAHTTTT